ncbi:MAG: hypothetical protein GTN93_04815, partial [Anaerolineae bacterium]|nr:hypothetical protein [Anaerolineae bacterium]
RLKNPPLVLPEDLQTVLQHHCNVPVKVLGEPGVDRSVAACWNLGCKQAMCEGADKLMIFANDVLLKPDTIDQLLEFGEEHQDVALWSALNDRHPQKRPSTTIGDSADFSCFMLRDRTLKRHGWFDERFRPAYF